MNGLLEARPIVPVDNTLVMRGSSCYHGCCHVGRIFHPHCDRWRIVPVAVIQDQLGDDPREASSSNGRRYNFRQ